MDELCMYRVSEDDRDLNTICLYLTMYREELV